MTVLDTDRWQARFDELAAKHEVPGAALAVEANGERIELATGVLDASKGTKVTPDTIFPIASISKVLTSTVVMRLVERGMLDLDAPVEQLLPELSLPVWPDDIPVTLRHLQSHVSGFDGDNFADTGDGEDALERYAATCSGLLRLAAPETVFSYGNAGFNLAGRVIERMTGKTWNTAMQDELFDPLRLERTVTRPEQATAFLRAVGHLQGRPAANWPVPRSGGPSAGILCSVGDLLTFGCAHQPGQERVLAAGSIAEMQRAYAAPPDDRVAAGWGIGWMLSDWQGRRAVGHDGGAVGIASYLRLLPGHDTTLALLTNGGNGGGLYHRLFSDIAGALHGIAVPADTAVPESAGSLDLRPYVGAYHRSQWDLDTRLEGERLLGTLRIQEPVSSEFERDTLELEFRPIDERRFVYRSVDADDVNGWAPAYFFDVPAYGGFIHMWSRSAPRIS